MDKANNIQVGDIIKAAGRLKGAKPYVTSIEQVNDNNGWTKINGPESLPPPGEYTVLCESGSIETVKFEDHFRTINVWLMYYTHWRPKVVIPKPLY